jgi:hypothetical protein
MFGQIVFGWPKATSNQHYIGTLAGGIQRQHNFGSPIRDASYLAHSYAELA